MPKTKRKLSTEDDSEEVQEVTLSTASADAQEVFFEAQEVPNSGDPPPGEESTVGMGNTTGKDDSPQQKTEDDADLQQPEEEANVGVEDTTEKDDSPEDNDDQNTIPDNFDSPYEREFNLEDELPLFVELNSYLNSEDNKDDPLQKRNYECHQTIKRSKQVYSEQWLQALKEEATKLQSLQPYHLLLCLVSDSFCRCEAATLRSICKQLELPQAVLIAVEEWQLQAEFPLVVSQATQLLTSHEQKRVPRSILFLARTYYALKTTVSTTESSGIPDEDLLVVVRKVLQILEDSAEHGGRRRHSKNRKRPATNQEIQEHWESRVVRDGRGKFVKGGSPGRPSKVAKAPAAAEEESSKDDETSSDNEEEEDPPDMMELTVKQRILVVLACSDNHQEERQQLRHLAGVSNKNTFTTIVASLKKHEMIQEIENCLHLTPQGLAEVEEEGLSGVRPPAAMEEEEEDDQKMPARTATRASSGSSRRAAAAADDDLIRPSAANLDGMHSLFQDLKKQEEKRHQQELDRHRKTVKTLKEALAVMDQLQGEAEQSDETIRVEIENQVKQKVMKFFQSMGTT